MLTESQAQDLSQMIADPTVMPELKRQARADLWHYYRELTSTTPAVPCETTRRWPFAFTHSPTLSAPPARLRVGADPLPNGARTYR